MEVRVKQSYHIEQSARCLLCAQHYKKVESEDGNTMQSPLLRLYHVIDKATRQLVIHLDNALTQQVKGKVSKH